MSTDVEKIVELETELKKQIHRATNAEYMRDAYKQMLGPKRTRGC